ncbi:MAG: hypothetical protein KAV87_18935 [Desulfobacteraceae bacterium]|nr:hypothetical protein [Desulfobacteraceae bacterium]
MPTTINPLVVLKDAKWKHWRDTLYWLLFTVFGSGLPIYGGWLLLKLRSSEVELADFYQNGEFALYCAAILGSTLYLMSRGGYRDIFIHMRLFSFLATVFLVIATLLFCGARTGTTEDSSIVNLSLLISLSTILLILTLILGFLVNLIDTSRVDMNPRAAQKKLNDEFDAIGEE